MFIKNTLKFLMMSLIDRVFGKEDAQKIISAAIELEPYKEVSSEGLYSMFRQYCDMETTIGFILAAQLRKIGKVRGSVPSFVQIGCGLSIPALTLSRLGYSGIAFDKRSKEVTNAVGLGLRLRTGVRHYDADFHGWMPTVEKGSFLIADKVSDEFGYRDTEPAVVKYAIENGCGMAVVPLVDLRKVGRDNAAKICSKYIPVMKEAGYNVQCREVYNRMLFPHLMVIGVKLQNI